MLILFLLIFFFSSSPATAADRCVTAPVLMYHHVQPYKDAVAKKQTALTVVPDAFRKQLQYLRDKKYNVITSQDLINFFDANTSLPSKPVLLTFDDGYSDMSNVVLPVLKEFNFPATFFLSTGLVNNKSYLTWDEIKSVSSSNFIFANHTWSHALSTSKKIDWEISTADTQLRDNGINTKIFAYPYGSNNNNEITILKKYGYQLAFTTRKGTRLCASNRFLLPRLRIGNASLSSYGL